jgi:hypothetical protein
MKPWWQCTACGRDFYQHDRDTALASHFVDSPLCKRESRQVSEFFRELVGSPIVAYRIDVAADREDAAP